MSRENLSLAFPFRPDTNQPIKLSRKMARGLKFRIWEEEGLYYICSENKGADLRLCFGIYAKSRFSHDPASMVIFRTLKLLLLSP